MRYRAKCAKTLCQNQECSCFWTRRAEDVTSLRLSQNVEDQTGKRLPPKQTRYKREDARYGDGTHPVDINLSFQNPMRDVYSEEFMVLYVVLCRTMHSENGAFMATSSTSANAYGAQMAKYFTMNQPPRVAIDSIDSVVRPQMAITRLIARSGIPERTASIPSERAYVVSVHLNPASKGEWELWTDGKHTKTGPWPTGGVAMCDLESDSSIRNPGAIDWIHYHVPRATLDALTDDARMPRVKRLHCTYGTADPTLYHLTQLIVPCLKTPEMFSQLFMDYFTLMISSHLVGKYGQSREEIPHLEGGLAPWQKRRVVELVHEHLDGEIKLATLADECGLSVSHFARSFRKSFGTSAHQYLILHRIEIAKTLLAQTQNSLSEIAGLTGFTDQAALTKTFATVVGAPPGKWKREILSRKTFVEAPTEKVRQRRD